MRNKELIFRRTLRLPIPAATDSVDAMLIEHIEELERDSPHRMQEWIRNCLRNAYMQEQLILAQKSHGHQGEGV